MDIKLLAFGILFIIAIILSLQIFIIYIKIRMDIEQRSWFHYIKEYSLKISIIILGLSFLISITKDI